MPRNLGIFLFALCVWSVECGSCAHTRLRGRFVTYAIFISFFMLLVHFARALLFARDHINARILIRPTNRIQYLMA